MLIIGIAGGTGSGKTTVVSKIINSLPEGEVAVLPQDSYYKDSSHIPPEDRSKINFDEPAAIEWTLLVEHLKQLKEGKTIQVPTYSYLTCTRQEATVEVAPCDVVIVEGILVLNDPVLRELMDVKVFVAKGLLRLSVFEILLRLGSLRSYLSNAKCLFFALLV